MLTLIITLLSLGSIAFLLFKFFTTDGDFTLISKKQAKREEIEDKVVWITGASRGIVKIKGVGNSGEAIAKQCAGLGAKLILSARNEAELERVKSELTGAGKYAPDKVIVLPLDLGSNEDSLTEAVKKAESSFGGVGVDYMIHNAAFERPKAPAMEVGDEGMKATFNINVFGTITLTRLLVPAMLKRRRGHLVVMSSAAGKTPSPGQAVYSATKFALNGYFHTLRSELIGKGLKVTVICPGPVETSGCGSSEKRISAERCAELTIIAATHSLKEAWISYQPVLGVMYLAQYMPTLSYLLMDKIGAKRLNAAAEKRSTYSLSSIIWGNKKAE